MGDMIKTSKNVCKSCKYSMIMNETIYACDYMGRVGELRNCPIGWCDKYKPKPKRKSVMRWRGQGFKIVEADESKGGLNEHERSNRDEDRQHQ